MQKLRVWWMPQVPMESMKIEVDSVKEGVKIMDVLAKYDAFQHENNIKPDYSNAGGLEMSKDDKEWEDWEIEDEGLGYFDDPEDYVKLTDVLEEA